MGGGSPGGHLLFDRRWWMTSAQPPSDWPRSYITEAIGAPGPAWGTKASTGIQISPNVEGIDSRRKCNYDSNELLIGENHFLFSQWVKTDGDGGVFALTDRSDRPIWWKENRTVRLQACHQLIMNKYMCIIIIPLLLNLILLSCFCTTDSVNSALIIILPRWEILYLISFQSKEKL